MDKSSPPVDAPQYTNSHSPNPMKDKILLEEEGALQTSPLNLDPTPVNIDGYNTTPQTGNKQSDELAESLQTPPTSLFPSEDPVGDIVEDYVQDYLGDIAPELSYNFGTQLPPTPPSGSFSLSERAVRDAVTPVDDTFDHPFDHAPRNEQDHDITHVHSLVSSLMTMKGRGNQHQQPSTPPQVATSLESSVLPPLLSDDASENKDTIADAVADAFSFISSSVSTQNTDLPSKSHNTILPSSPAKLDAVAPSDLSSSATQIEAIPALVSSIFPSVLADDDKNNEPTNMQPEKPSLLSSVLPGMDSNPAQLETNDQSSSTPMEDASLLVSASAVFTEPNSADIDAAEITPPPVAIINSPEVSRETPGGNKTDASNIDRGFALQNSHASSANDDSNATLVGDTYLAKENEVVDAAVIVDDIEAFEVVDDTIEERAIRDEISSRTLQMPQEGAIANPVEKSSTIHSNPSVHPSQPSASKEEENINLVASVLVDFNSSVATSAGEPRRFSAGETSISTQNKAVQFDFAEFMNAAPELPEKKIDSSPLPPLTRSSPPAKEGDLTKNSVVSSLDALPAVEKRSMVMSIEDEKKAKRLHERLSYFTSVAERHVSPGFSIATIVVTSWCLFTAFVALYLGRFGLAAGISISAGGSVYLLQKRRKGAEEVLERARSTISASESGSRKNELYEKTSQLFSAVLEQVFDVITTLVASIFTPISLTIPAVFIALFGVSGFWPTLFTHLGFGMLGLPFLAASLLMYGKARKLAVGKAEAMLKPKFDAALLGETSEKTPLIVSAV